MLAFLAVHAMRLSSCATSLWITDDDSGTVDNACDCTTPRPGSNTRGGLPNATMCDCSAMLGVVAGGTRDLGQAAIHLA